MPLSALAVNILWSASHLPSYRRFRKALGQPLAAQEDTLQRNLRLNTATAFGKAHHFDQIQSYAEFARRVPLSEYESFEPWVQRIREGEPNVLTKETVTHLVPTSGSTAARKLIPFTQGLQREFNAAIGPWLLDLQIRFPGLAGGLAYWSITPALGITQERPSAVPIGFDSDTAYLGGARRRLADAVMAVPGHVQRAKTLEEFRFQTLLHLLRCRELRLISVWHPSFLTLLLDALPNYWSALLDAICQDSACIPRSLTRRVQELRQAEPGQPGTIWPNLKVISCWGDANAELAIGELNRRFPSAFIQRKGLLATEAFVSIPFAERHVLSVTSHFYEFLDAGGRVRLAPDLKEGDEYEVVVTTSGGLYRYRLQDRVLVTGFLEKTPALRFRGRIGIVSDRFGEKLSETFVDGVIEQLLRDLPSLPRFIFLAPDEGELSTRYTLYLEGRAPLEITQRLDALLRTNPQYALCRDLGQLQEPGLFLISAGGYETFVLELSKSKRLGEIKPCSFSAFSGWSKRFHGYYATAGVPTR